ncbi:hypothetical protein SAMN05216219_1595 [Mycetocola miduiensis]|uniref:Uncharacterized protein n=1 Tax=Mycetocola miduiensis TaxID=995034 RepID=A0A1I5AXE5_9MICO|nr:hypothetical protein SAMN05216219_1595 [Mycetocola miduiensis]
MTVGFESSKLVMGRLTAAGAPVDRVESQHPDMVLLGTVLGLAETLGADYRLLFAAPVEDISAAFFLARPITSPGSSPSASTSSKN